MEGTRLEILQATVPCSVCKAAVLVSLDELALESAYYKANPTEPKKKYYCNLICLNKGRNQLGVGREGKGGRKPYRQTAELGLRPPSTLTNESLSEALSSLDF